MTLGAGPSGYESMRWPVQAPCVPLALPRRPGRLPPAGQEGGFRGCARLHKGQGDHFVSPNSPRGHSRTGHRKRQTTEHSGRGPAARCHTLQGVRACGQRGRPSAGCGKEGTGGNGLGSSPSGFQVILFKSEFTPGFYLSAASGPQGGAPWQSLAFTVPARGPAEAEGLAQHAGLPRVMKGGVTRDSPPTRRVYPGTLSSGPGAEQATERVACWGPGPPCPSCHLLQMPRPAGGPPED